MSAMTLGVSKTYSLDHQCCPAGTALVERQSTTMVERPWANLSGDVMALMPSTKVVEMEQSQGCSP